VPSKSSNIRMPKVIVENLDRMDSHNMWDSLEVFYRLCFISAFKFDCFDVCIICTGIFNLFLSYIIQQF